MKIKLPLSNDEYHDLVGVADRKAKRVVIERVALERLLNSYSTAVDACKQLGGKVTEGMESDDG